MNINQAELNIPIKSNREDMKANRMRDLTEYLAHKWFFINALIAVISVVAITLFVFYKGLQPFIPIGDQQTYSLWDFISGIRWDHNDDVSLANYGVLYMVIASVLSTIGAITIGVPISILTAIFIAEVAPLWLKKIVKPSVELLAGIPSVLYGIFGLAVFVPFVQKISPQPQGQSLLAVILVLAVMILPTVISISESAINSVPQSFREASYGLGASKIQTIFKVVIPSAKSGILAGVVLGIGRAIGETMAVMLVAGNSTGGIPGGLFDIIRPLTTNIAMQMGYAAGLQQKMLFATGVVLFIFIMCINLILNKLTSKMNK